MYQNDLDKASAKILTAVRSLVSKDKYRLKDEELGVDLDLTYITDRIIAMGYPSEALTSLYRNNINDVAKFFEIRHPGRYMIYNLVSNSESVYDIHKFGGRVQYYGWLDHHAPPLSLLCELVQSMDSFLAANEKNVVAIHCKAGRGRTGSVVASLLLYLNYFDDPLEALQFFAQRRSKTREGVAVPSQIRYVGYLHRVIKVGFPRPKKVILKSIQMDPIPAIGLSDEAFAPCIQISEGHKPLSQIYSNCFEEVPRYYRYDPSAKLGVGLEMEGDYIIRIYHQSRLANVLPDQQLIRIQFHTSFIEGDTMILTKRDLDASSSGRLKDSRFPPNFRVILSFQLANPPPVNRSNRPNPSNKLQLQPNKSNNDVPPVSPFPEELFSDQSNTSLLPPSSSLHYAVSPVSSDYSGNIVDMNSSVYISKPSYSFPQTQSTPNLNPVSISPITTPYSTPNTPISVPGNNYSFFNSQSNTPDRSIHNNNNHNNNTSVNQNNYNNYHRPVSQNNYSSFSQPNYSHLNQNNSNSNSSHYYQNSYTPNLHSLSTPNNSQSSYSSIKSDPLPDDLLRRLQNL